jgi:hypothetical protein
VLIYLLLAGASSRTVRATLLSFFVFAYAASLASHVVTLGIRTGTWLSSRDPFSAPSPDGLSAIG